MLLGVVIQQATVSEIVIAVGKALYNYQGTMTQTAHTAILLIANNVPKLNSSSLFTTPSPFMQIILQLPHYMILSGTYRFVSKCNLGL